MSLENEDQISPEEHAETLCQPQKHSKISYTRDLLLSFSELAICKTLPGGFDQSLLTELGDASHGMQDRPRIPGSLPLQSFKRGEYGSSPPSKGDSSTYSRGTYGRWENRASGRNDRDSDSQSDWDSESGRRYGNQSRRSWQSSEHDGLLGSGSFPRPPGVLAPKVRPNDHSQLNKSNEPYHPPRPYKAVPHTRSTTDSHNDETFGSTECTSDDRAAEERRRRDSFELMRKEQKKALQEQKLNPDKHRIDPLSEAFLEDTKDEKKHLASNNDLDETVFPQASDNDSRKPSFPSQTPASRPLVPPGFTTTILERNSGVKSLIHNDHPAETGVSLSHGKANSMKNGTLHNQEERESAKQMDLSEQRLRNTSIDASLLNKDEKIVNLSSALQVSNNNLGMNDQLYQTSSLSESPGTLDNREIFELDTEEVTTHKITGNSNQDHSASVLQRLFSSALTVNTVGSSGYVENHDSKPGDTGSPSSVHSSKFAHWFLEEEKKPAPSASDLLSLIVGGDKAGTHVSDAKISQLVQPNFSSQSSELTTVGMSEQFHIHIKQEAIPAVLTCEDLEQTILSEFTGKHVQGLSVSGAKIEQPKTDIDNLASQHLLSLLQKGTSLKEMTTHNLVIESKDKLHASEVPNIENTPNSGKTVTLETLFGSAFMEELQSVEAPVSVQRGSVGSARIDVSEPHGLPFRVIDDSLLASSVGEIESNRVRSDSNFSGKVENWLGLNNPRSEADPLKFQSEAVSKPGGFDGRVEIQLPEEESLITASDPFNTSNTPVFIDERSMVGHEGRPFVRGSYGLMDTEIFNRNPLAQQQSSPKFHAPQMNHMRPLFHHPLDHQFPANMLRPPFHQPNAGPTEFDLPGHHPMQQRHMRGNFPQFLRENPRGGPLSQPHNQPTSFIRDLNPMQRFPFGQPQPNFSGLGMPIPAPDVGSGSNHPEAFQRLMETELRANSKQIHPFVGAGHSQGMYGNELDMGFRYR